MVESTQSLLRVRELKVGSEPFIIETPIQGVFLIQRPRYEDFRGAFQEQFRIPDISSELGREVRILQAQISESNPGVLRGIHAEPQDKIITPIAGRLSAVVVDLREDSETFKKWLKLDFDLKLGEARTSLFIPEGMGNSFCVHEDSGVVLYQYAVSQTYDSKTAGMGVRYDDSELAIPWPVKNPIISDRDKRLPTLKEFLNGRK